MKLFTFSVAVKVILGFDESWISPEEYNGGHEKFTVRETTGWRGYAPLRYRALCRTATFANLGVVLDQMLGLL